MALIEPATPQTSELRIIAGDTVLVNVLVFPNLCSGMWAGGSLSPTVAGGQMLVRFRGPAKN